MVPSQSLNKPSSSITSNILKEGKVADGLPGAFVTLLAGNGDDIMGVVCLAKGLRKVKSAYPLVVAVLPGVPEGHLQRLESQGCILTKIQPIYSTQLGCSVINFTKLRLWDLFDYPEEEHGDCGVVYAVLDCFCEKMSADNPQYNIKLCQEKLYFNDGLFVFEPSKKTFNYLVETLELIPPTPTPFAVQVNSNATQQHFGLMKILDYLNKSFEDVYQPISLIYNLNLPMLWNHSEHVVDVDRVKVIHYCAKGFYYLLLTWGMALVQGSLPWRYTEEEENMQREDVKLLVKKWWDVYNDESLDYKPPAEDSLEPD
ncbi:galactinol synthase 1 isoform X1 [Cinnamomum micranthum f. kanehirae]|uniref:Galactinol synthase 1 isoform X1 n=1 Tax=Cinnamomum micranthum f. kanehirae TaxID=337451 RepID=A0A443PUB6_9MAGN|nr:galactinol synthase 1 isoform X1 [Cinnamomum micranthum f. kanehirae]